MKPKPAYDMDKLRFATDAPTFKRAINLYENGKVTEFRPELNGYFATVQGGNPYQVYVSNKHFDHGKCDCYLGKNDTLCKHMVATAIRAVTNGKPLTKKDKEITESPVCSGKLGELNKQELLETKLQLSTAKRYIKAYVGPSRTWFHYQNSLDEGCNRLSAIVSKLPVSQQTSKLLVKLLLQLDKKLTTGGVDDSNGTVGGFIQDTVDLLQEYAKLDPSCISTFKALENKETCFGWEEPLLAIKDA